MHVLIRAVRLYVPDEHKEAFYRAILPGFDKAGWKGHADCLGFDPVYDKVIYDLYPQWKP